MGEEEEEEKKWGERGRERWREVGGLCHHDCGHCVRDHRLHILPTQL